MKSANTNRYPVPGVTLHRVTAAPRSQGDGEEQAPLSTQASTETTPKSLMLPTPKPPKEPKVQWVDERAAMKDKKEREKPSPIQTTQDKVSSLGETEPTDCNLPEIMEIASKLTKVSIMSSPDSQLLNAVPKDLNTKKKILLLPKSIPSSLTNTGSSSSSRLPAAGRSKGKKDPRFVPYEPYKGCVKPILLRKKKKCSRSSPGRRRSSERVTEGKGEGKSGEHVMSEGIQMMDKDAELKNAEKLSILVRDFEGERASWEEKVSSLTMERKSLEEQMAQLKKEKTNLEGQLSVQSQVNTELKRLLVASVGEEVQGRVQCLTEDKARMATMIRRYSEKVDRDYEEKERIGIQCDVWRSKFLASSMMVDELVGMRVALAHKLEEAEEALKVLLAEHDLARQSTLNMYKMNKQLREAFDPLAAQSGGLPPLPSADLVTLAVEGSVLAETVRDRLLGELGRSVGCSLSLDGLETHTPGQKIARQLLHQLEGSQACSSSGGGEGECSTVCPGRPALLHRFHPNTRYEHLTVNCCAHCNGEIKVV